MGYPTCDPAQWGMPYVEDNLAQGEHGEVLVTYRYNWDGVSVKPDCNGPIIYLAGRNDSAVVTYYAHFQGRGGTTRHLEMPPGSFYEENRRQRLINLGFVNRLDMDGLVIDTFPTTAL